MNPDEIQALREKHHNDGNGCCAFCTDGYVWAADYPCDVVKVLDAWDEATPTEATSSECDHEWLRKDGAGYRWIVSTGCPKCGEKL